MNILPHYSYYNDILSSIQHKQPWLLSEVYEVGARFCGKTINVGAAVIKAHNTINDFGEIAKVGSLILRKNRDSMCDTWDDYLKLFKDEIQEQGATPIKSEHKIYYENGNKMVFDFVKKQSRLYGKGKSQIEGDYIFCVFEEATEFTKEDIRLVYNAVRGWNPKAQIITIFITNTDVPSSYVIKKCRNIMSFDEQTLYNIGYQFRLINDDTSSEHKKMLIHYINWRAIQKYHKEKAPNTKLGYRYVADEPIIVPQYKLDNLVKAYDIDEVGAKVDDIGYPGGDVSYVFLRYLSFVQPAVYYNHSFIVGGGDVGFGKKRGSGYTGFLFVGYDKDGTIDVYNEFKWDQKVEYKNTIEILSMVVEFYTQCAIKYCQMTNSVINEKYPLIVKVDWSAAESIDILNDVSRQRGCSSWLRFVPCYKVPLWDSFALIDYYFSKGNIRIADSCINFKEELSNIQIDQEATSFKTIGPDHLIDCFRYALGNMLYSFIDKDSKPYFAKLLTNKGKKNII